MLDGDDSQPCFGFPHRKERKTQRFGLENVVELGDHRFQIWFSIKRNMDVMVDWVKQQWFGLMVHLLWWLGVVKMLILVKN